MERTFSANLWLAFTLSAILVGIFVISGNVANIMIKLKIDANLVDLVFVASFYLEW